jgi:hypothetical protein
MRVELDSGHLAYYPAIARLIRWSTKTDALVRYVASRCRPGFQSELGHWLESSTRFAGFVAAHQDKIRKKLTTSVDEETRLNVRAELLVAYLMLGDRRFELEFEAYGARRRGPDFTATFRARERFNLEVTRMHGSEPATTVRVANVIAGKLRQLPGEMPNVLVLATSGVGSEQLSTAARLLKAHAEAKDDTFFARRGFEAARDFYAQYLHLSAVFVLDEAMPAWWQNREARRPMDHDAAASLENCLAVKPAASLL